MLCHLVLEISMLVSEVLEVSECQEFLPLIFNILLTTQLDANMDATHRICNKTFCSATNFDFSCWGDYFRCDTLLSYIHSAWCLQLGKVTHKSASLHTRDNQGYIYGHSFLLPKDIISMLEMGQKLNKILILHAGHTTKEFNIKNDGVHSLNWIEHQGLCSA